MVKKTTLLTTGLIVGGSVLALKFLSDRFDVGGVFLRGVGSIANTIGQGVGLIPGQVAAGAIEGGARGFGKVGEILPAEASPGGSTNALGFTFETALQNLRDNLSLGGLLNFGSNNNAEQQKAGAGIPDFIPQAAGEPSQTTSAPTVKSSAIKISGVKFTLPPLPQFDIFRDDTSKSKDVSIPPTPTKTTTSQTTSAPTNTVDNFFGSGKIVPQKIDFSKIFG